MNNKRRTKIRKGLGFIVEAEMLLRKEIEKLNEDAVVQDLRRDIFGEIFLDFKHGIEFLQKATDEEQDCYDNLMDSMKDSSTGIGFEERLEIMDESMEKLNDAYLDLKNIYEFIPSKNKNKLEVYDDLSLILETLEEAPDGFEEVIL